MSNWIGGTGPVDPSDQSGSCRGMVASTNTGTKSRGRRGRRPATTAIATRTQRSTRLRSAWPGQSSTVTDPVAIVADHCYNDARQRQELGRSRRLLRGGCLAEESDAASPGGKTNNLTNNIMV